MDTRTSSGDPSDGAETSADGRTSRRFDGYALEPGDEIGGEHVFLAASGHLDPERDITEPHLGTYPFESAVTVVPDDGEPYEVTLEFSVSIRASDPG